MNILILGSGGREHALAWKLAQSKKVDRIYTGPGNAGTSREGINLPVNPENFEEVKRAVVDNNIGMVVVGPEASLVAGIYDFFSNDRLLGDVPLIGPGKTAALLEGSKAFAKDFMTRHKIPTAPYKSFEQDTIHESSEFLRSFDPPYVIKADGLAAGKGVLIYDNLSDAEKEVAAMMDGKFGTAGQKVVIEQFLEGIELSVFIITDGNSYKMLPEAKDYKRIGVGDTGLNTGGMGAVSPVPFADTGFMQRVRQRIIDPTIKGLSDDGIVYKGFIFFGLMNVDGNPYVVEYNVRMGDPEAEATVPRIKSDLFELLEGVAEGNLSERNLEIDERFVSTVIIASGGYPEHYEKGKEIIGLEQNEGCVIFHSGTKISDGKIVTSGGRVLAVSAWGKTMEEALSGSYKNAERISFGNMYYRTDIGFDLH